MDTNAEPRPKVTLTAQGQYLRLHVPFTAPTTTGGLRSGITGFSRASRKRMLETLARIDFARAGFVAFATLTYPDRDGPPSHDKADRDRDVFQKRLLRRFPGASGIWRREWEARKSGGFTGTLYPHYHYLLFNLPFVHYSDLNRWWGEVLEYDGGDLRTEIKGVANWRQALSYVAKYMAKPTAGDDTESEDGTADEDGRGFAAAGEAPGPGGAPGGGDAADRSLVYGAYLTGEDQEGRQPDTEDPGLSSPAKATGRHWGLFNRRRLPFAPCQSKRLPMGDWLKDFRTTAGTIYPPIAEITGCGFTLFTEDAPEWLDLAERLQQGETS